MGIFLLNIYIYKLQTRKLSLFVLKLGGYSSSSSHGQVQGLMKPESGPEPEINPRLYKSM